jgi:hypothetical protein
MFFENAYFVIGTNRILRDENRTIEETVELAAKAFGLA